ncbi:NADPH-dependent FMN reductase [Mycena albidolilacea]|uniref:NADPH-dependent FMN reductase n=1 Tax=Mycena albidolilacea TaxID=1033008 RepID=A0AAD7APY4_9AGAR|nr:NADPH-dependent FMN reductase [Mycena albidolilacea]
MTAKRVALIIASTRTPRVGPAISKVALGVIVPLLPDHITVTVVDLKDHPLPLYTADPIIPAGIPRPIADTAYADPATNAWSALVRGFDAFIFLTPQYNWGYPASLKLALDALYHEWAGKPALVLSYGNRGGGKAAGQLRQVLDGLRMRTCTRGVELAFGEGHDLGGGAIGEGTNNRWRAEDKKEELVAAWGELADLIDTEVPATRRD